MASRRIPFAAALIACGLLTSLAHAGQITVQYEEALINGPVTVDPTTTLLNSSTPNIRFKFFVPDYASILSLNSVDITLHLFDDGDNGVSDRGDATFVVRNVVSNSNITLGSFSTLDGYILASPQTFNYSINPGDYATVLSEIQGDGYFFVRVNRNSPSSSDFYTKDVSVSIDANVASAPEPATMGILGGGLAAIAALARRRKARI